MAHVNIHLAHQPTPKVELTANNHVSWLDITEADGTVITFYGSTEQLAELAVSIAAAVEEKQEATA